MKIERSWKSFDFVLLTLVCVLAVMGVMVISSAAPASGNKQNFIFLSGIVLLLVVAFIDYRFISKFYILIYIVNLVLLVIVFYVGSDVNEAKNVARWISIGGFLQIQPSEFSKVFLIIFLATYIDKYMDKLDNIFFIISTLVLTMIPVILVVKQPSLSAALVNIAIMLSILFIAGINYKYIMAVLGVGIPAISFFYYDLVYNKLNFIISLSGGILKPYHFARILSFVEKSEVDDLYRQTYHSLVAISTGGLYGKGLREGTFNNLGFVPHNSSDFIFSVIGEELGFIGCVAALLITFFIIVKFFLIANRTTSRLGKLIIAGVIGMFVFQAFVNAAVATDLIVNTGMPFPFLSQGGSSMWVNMICIGLVINVGMEKPKSIFEG